MVPAKMLFPLVALITSPTARLPAVIAVTVSRFSAIVPEKLAIELDSMVLR